MKRSPRALVRRLEVLEKRSAPTVEMSGLELARRIVFLWESQGTDVFLIATGQPFFTRPPIGL